MPPSVLKKLAEHPLTDNGLVAFLALEDHRAGDHLRGSHLTQTRALDWQVLTLTIVGLDTDDCVTDEIYLVIAASAFARRPFQMMRHLS